MVEEEKELSGVFYKDIYHLPKASPQNTNTVGTRFQHVNFVGDTNIQSAAPTLCSVASWYLSFTGNLLSSVLYSTLNLPSEFLILLKLTFSLKPKYPNFTENQSRHLW